MEVKAELPEGVPGELSYEWYDYDWANTENGAAHVATGSTFEVSSSYYDLLNFDTKARAKQYYPVVTNTYTDENGNVQKIRVQGNIVYVNGTVVGSEAEPLTMLLVGLGSLLLTPIATPIGLLLSPIAALTGGAGMVVVGPFLLPLIGVIYAAKYFLKR